MKDDSALTPLEVAEILKISKNTVYELVKRGELKGYKVGKKVRIDRSDVEEYKNSTKNNKSKNNHIDHIEVGYSSGFIISGQDFMLLDHTKAATMAFISFTRDRFKLLQHIFGMEILANIMCLILKECSREFQQ
jgi:excisionase family DNA binding protein